MRKKKPQYETVQKPKRKALCLLLALCLTVTGVCSAVGVTAFAQEGKNGSFNGVDAAVDDAGELIVNDINFPDEAFRAFILETFDLDDSGTVSEEESVSHYDAEADETVHRPYPFDCSGRGIKDLTGIDYFPVSELDCSDNELRSLDLSGMRDLVYLTCSDNYLSTLDLSGMAELDYVDCSDNQLTKLDLTGCTFVADFFYCKNNFLTEVVIPKDCDSMKFDFTNNHLRSITVPDTFAGSLICDGNNLTSIYLPYDEETHSAGGGITGEQFYGNAERGETMAVEKRDGGYVFDMAEFLGKEVAKDVISVEGANYDRETGLAVFAQVPEHITYLFDVTGRVSKGEEVDPYVTPLKVTLTSVVEAGRAEISEKNFPDPVFRKYVADEFDENGDDLLSPSEIAHAVSIWTFDRDGSPIGVSDLTGIEYFTNLSGLYCQNNKLRKLDLTKNTRLTEVVCNGNELESLNVRGLTKLYELDCQDNRLTELDLSTNTNLRIFDVSGNRLTSLAPVTDYFGVYSGSPQTYTDEVRLTPTDGGYVFDVSAFLGKYASRVISVTGAKYDRATGRAVFAELPKQIEYRYIVMGEIPADPASLVFGDSDTILGATYAQNIEKMDVTLTNIKVGTAVEQNVLTDAQSQVSATFPTDKSEYYAGAVLTAEKQESGEAFTLAADALADRYSQFVPYEFTLTDADGNPLAVSGKLSVRVPVPSGWNASDTAVYYVAPDGKTERLACTPADDGTSVVFETDHFSVYALVNLASAVAEPGTSESDTPTSPQTGDSKNPALWVLLMGCSGLALLSTAAYRKKFVK